MLKIAHVQLLPLLTGVQRVTLDELTRLDRNCFEPYIVCKEQGPMTLESAQYDINCIYSSNLIRNISLIKDFKAFWHLYRLFKEYKFDIVHTHSSKTGVIGRIAAKLAGVPMVVHTIHGFAFPSATNKIVKLIYFFMEWLGTTCSDKIICLHETDRDFAKKYLRASNQQLEIVPNGVDIKKFSPPTNSQKESVKKELNISSESVVIGMVGRLWRQKNPKLLLDSMLSLLKANHNVHLVFVGDGELREELESIIKANDISNQVHLLGWCSNSNWILKGFDIFVLPSLWEGMPLAILEAQATGLPCVVSNIQGNNHLVEDEVNGLLFNSGDKDELTSVLNRLIENASLRTNFGRAGLLRVRKEYSIENRVKNIVNCYIGNNQY